MKAPSAVFFPGMVGSVPILQLHMRLFAGGQAQSRGCHIIPEGCRDEEGDGCPGF